MVSCGENIGYIGIPLPPPPPPPWPGLVSNIIGLIERNTGQRDFIQFRLDWLYDAVVRYSNCDNIPSGEAVMVLIQEATELLSQSECDGFSQNLSFQAEFTATGERGRRRFIISRDQLTFLLDLGFKSGEIACLLGVSESTIKRRILEYETFVRQRYSNIADEALDSVVEGLMREFPNCGYKKMTGLLLNAGHRIQQNRIRECMRRVNPEVVLLRALELRTVRRRRYQVSGPPALWHIDGNHKLIRYSTFIKKLINYK